MTSLKVLKFGPEDAFHSLATKMLKEALKKDPGRWWYIGSTLFSEDYPLENIARLGYLKLLSPCWFQYGLVSRAFRESHARSVPHLCNGFS